MILLATLTYFLAPASVTYHHLGRSLYFSIVTFVTLGYGDISQTSSRSSCCRPSRPSAACS